MPGDCISVGDAGTRTQYQLTKIKAVAAPVISTLIYPLINVRHTDIQQYNQTCPSMMMTHHQEL